jgi:hypothetical protein
MLFQQIGKYSFLIIIREAILFLARPRLPGRSIVRSLVGRAKGLRLLAAA